MTGFSRKSEKTELYEEERTLDVEADSFETQSNWVTSLRELIQIKLVEKSRDFTGAGKKKIAAKKNTDYGTTLSHTSKMFLMAPKMLKKYHDNGSTATRQVYVTKVHKLVFLP